MEPTQNLISLPDLVTALTPIIGEQVREAIKAANPPDQTQVPGQSTKAASNVNLKRYSPFPSFQRSVVAAKNGQFRAKDVLERDFVQAAAETFGFAKPDDEDEEDDRPVKMVGQRIYWPKDWAEARRVFETMAEKQAVKSIEQIETAIKSVDAAKAMTESSTNTFTAGSAGGFLVPPEFAQSLFAYALVPRVALRQIPGILIYQANSPTVYLPRESTAAGASQTSEAGTLTPADATLSEQTITIKKRYAMRRWSSELAGDSNPAFSTFLNRTLGRDLAIQEDVDLLTGDGTSNKSTGLLSISGTTTPVSLGTNGRTPKADDVLDEISLLQQANTDMVDFAIGHPRTANSFRKEKDNEGRYLLSFTAGPVAYGAPGQPTLTLAGYLPFAQTTSIPITQTSGSNTDCSSIIFGDSSKVVLVERGGVEIMFSEHLYFATDELAIRAINRSTVAVLIPASLSIVTGVRA